jgi:drug/metabolite transporter (DMT)-like permease
VFILAGAVLLSYEGRVETVGFSGVILVVSACLSWAIDNNLTRKISAGDPIQIALIKGLLGGLVNLGIALGSGEKFPVFVTISVTAVVGFLGYGISLVLFVLALRYIGTARTGAYFSTAPFIGTIIAIPLLGETVTPFLAIAGILMGIGVWLHLTEKHSHEHNHKEMIHEHSHIHKEHHQHEHDIAFDPDIPHSHIHRHPSLLHTHPHFPDLHHRHDHD